jgi:hypothetical protein
MYESTDPFDLDALRAAPLAETSVEKILSTVPVRRPGREEFFRVNPHPDYTVDAWLLDWDNGATQATYWVAPIMRDEMVEEIRPYRLFTCMSRRSVPFLWPAKLPFGAGGQGSSWSSSALEIADVATKYWLRMSGNRDVGAYVYVKALGDLGSPNWPDETFSQLLHIGFKDRIIETAEHPAVRSLRGLE